MVVMLSGFSQLSWSPGIGDPTIGGWITVGLYFVAAANCWVTKRTLLRDTSEWRVWLLLALSFLCFGINKQLDLQSALTDIGRLLAHQQHWYDQRQTVQVVFIVAVGVVSVIALLTLLVWARRSPAPTMLALVGTTLVIGYVLIRAASFHHVDRFIGKTVLGFRWNWIIEMGGISIVVIAGFWRRAIG
jgi:hypothetical protein